MTFVSQVPDCPRIDNNTTVAELKHLAGNECAGAEPRDYVADQLGSHECAAAGRIKIIPREEWPERIREREAKKQRNLDLINTFGVKALHQSRTNYCWVNAVIMDAHVRMAYNGGPVTMLSPSSVGAPIKRYRNVGGNCSEALKRFAEVGACSQKMWAPNENTNSRLWTPEAAADAARHRVLEWDDLRPRDWEEFISTLLVPGRSVALCNYAMRHAVTALDPIINERGEIGFLAWNSGLYRDRNGFTQFFGRYAQPDDAVSIRVITIDARATA